MGTWGSVMETMAAAIAALVEGDLTYLATVRSASHRELRDAAEKLRGLFVSRSAVAKVLEDWRRGLFAAEDIQQWASFIRRGYFSGRVSCELLRPIPIEYDVNDEEVIVEIIGRLDQIGDQIDGHINACEQDEMLRTLQA
jgi:hypothetical protein